MKLLARVLLVVTIFWLVGNLFFFWLNAIVDSHFYWALAQYFKTGSYPFVHPFIYARPTTISPPLYSLVLLVLETLPQPGFLLRLVQTLLLGASGYLVFQILKSQTNREVALIAACLFVILPANTIYVDYLMSEILAQFLLALLAYLLIRGFYARAIWVGSIATLAKYSLIIYPVLALILLIRTRPKLSVWQLPLVGLVILLVWSYFNWRITGVVGLSDTRGIQLYNQLVWVGGVVPSEESQAMRQLRRYVPASVDIRRGYWDLQDYILPEVGRSWSEFDSILGSVARQALSEYPLAYLANTGKIFFRLHGPGLPYWSNLSIFGKPQGAYPLFCGSLGQFTTCSPVVKLPQTLSLWNGFVETSNWFYRHLFPLLTYGLFFPSLLWGLSQAKLRLISLLYLLGVIPIAAYVHPDTRYLVPFYPLLTLITASAIWTLRQKLR